MAWRDTAALPEEGEGGGGDIDIATRHEFTSNFSGFPHISIPVYREICVCHTYKNLHNGREGSLIRRCVYGGQLDILYHATQRKSIE